MRLLAQASDAQLRIGESITTIVSMDSGLVLRTPRNDSGNKKACRVICDGRLCTQRNAYQIGWTGNGAPIAR